MAELNWGLLRQPDYFGNALQAYRQGQEMRQGRDQRNALAMYRTNPQGAVDALYAAGDVQNATALEDRMTARQEQQRKQGIAAQYAGGDAAGARQTAIAGGDFELAASLDKLDERQRQAVKDAAAYSTQMGIGLKTLPPQQRAAYVQSQAPRLKMLGMTDEQIAAIPLDDAGIDAGLAQAQTVSDYFAGQRSDRSFNAEQDQRQWQRGFEDKKFNWQQTTDRSRMANDGARLALEGRRVAIAGNTQGQANAKVTEAQARDAFNARRISAANKVMTELEGGKGFDPTLSGAGSAMMRGNSRRYEAAKEEWADAIIRLTTGAAATKQEIAAAKKAYFPSFGDDAAVQRQKTEARMRIEQDAVTRAGAGMGPQGAAAQANRPSLDSIFGQ